MPRPGAPSIPAYPFGVWRRLLFERTPHGCVIIEHQPLDDGQRQGPVADELIVKGAEPEIRTLRVTVPGQQAHDLPLTHHIGNLLRRFRGGPSRFARRRFLVETTLFHEVTDRLLEVPASRLKVDIPPDARRPVSAQVQHLSRYRAARVGVAVNLQTGR